MNCIVCWNCTGDSDDISKVFCKFYRQIVPKMKYSCLPEFSSFIWLSPGCTPFFWNVRSRISYRKLQGIETLGTLHTTICIRQMDYWFGTFTPAARCPQRQLHILQRKDSDNQSKTVQTLLDLQALYWCPQAVLFSL